MAVTILAEARLMSDESSPSTGDAYDDVIKSLEEHYRQLFHTAYADASAYAHVLVTLRDLRRGLTRDHEVTELERWFNQELERHDGRERARGESESDASAT